ncbi:hypothetical protein BH24BAC1_BH24BAC1_13920 [soil metagenome]
MKKYVAYYRVSTAKQGASGLGLEAQQYAVLAFVKGAPAIVSEFTEVESGKKNNRAQLLLAIAECLSACAILRILFIIESTFLFDSSLLAGKVQSGSTSNGRPVRGCQLTRTGNC